MAGLLDLFSGRSSDIYGQGLLTPEQRGGLGNIGLLALAGKLGQLAGPSFSPVPDFGAALGQAAGAYGASQEGAGTAALNAILTGQKGRKLESELDYAKQSGPYFDKIIQALAGLGGPGGGTAATPETGSTGGGAAPPPGAGGGGGAGAPGTITLDQARQAAINAGFTGPAIDIAAATGMAESNGNPLAHNTKGEDSYGYMQLNAAAHGDKVKTFDLQEQMNQAFKISNGGTNFSPWTMYRNGQYRKYLPQGGAAPTAAAPAGGGGLLAPTAPNPLSDAEPMVGIPRPRVGPQAAGADLLAAGMSPEMVARYLARPAPGAGAAPAAVATSGGGGPLAAPPDAGGDPIMSVTSADQAGGGDAPAAPPRAGLPTMGPAGIELPPMQGPLAAPAPAAAAPAAPGPGLLAPSALPGTAPATPRGVNPAYGQVAAAIAAAALQASRAGMPTAPFTALLEAMKANPAYQAEVKRGEAGVALEYAPAMKEAEKAVELRYAQAIAAQTAAGNLPSQLILKTVEAQNAYKNSVAPLGLQATFDKDGNATVSDLPGFKKYAPEAAGAVEGAKPTPEMKNYDAYVKDAQMRNQPVLSRIDWERTRSQPDPERAARIALDLKVAEPLAAQAAAGVQAKPLLDEVVRLAYQTPEGMAGEGSAAAGKLMAAFGFAPTDRMSNAELLTGVQQRLIGPIREPGTSSDRDVSRYLLATPGLMSTGDGRVKMAEMTKALIDRNNELATVYRNNLGSPDLQQKLAAIHNKPLFSDEQRAAIDETIRTRGGTVPGGVTPGAAIPPAGTPPLPPGLPPGSVPAGQTKAGRPAYRSPDGKIWSE